MPAKRTRTREDELQQLLAAAATWDALVQTVRRSDLMTLLDQIGFGITGIVVLVLLAAVGYGLLMVAPSVLGFIGH